MWEHVQFEILVTTGRIINNSQPGGTYDNHTTQLLRSNILQTKLGRYCFNGKTTNQWFVGVLTLAISLTTADTASTLDQPNRCCEALKKQQHPQKPKNSFEFGDLGMICI